MRGRLRRSEGGGGEGASTVSFVSDYLDEGGEQQIYYGGAKEVVGMFIRFSGKYRIGVMR